MKIFKVLPVSIDFGLILLNNFAKDECIFPKFSQICPKSSRKFRENFKGFSKDRKISIKIFKSYKFFIDFLKNLKSFEFEKRLIF